MQKDFQLEMYLQRRVGSNWHLFLIIVQRMYTCQLTIDKECHSFVFSLLPVARFLRLLCAGSEWGLAAYPLGSGLTLLLLSSWFSSLSWRTNERTNGGEENERNKSASIWRGRSGPLLDRKVSFWQWTSSEHSDIIKAKSRVPVTKILAPFLAN